MPGDDLRKVQAGQQFTMPANAYNSFIDAARFVRGREQDRQSKSERVFRQSGIVLVRNASGSARERFDVLGIDAPVVSPSANLTTFQTQVAVDGITPVDPDHRGRFVVLLDPLAAGAIGRAYISGACPAKLYVEDDGHTYADIADGDPTALASGGSGSAQILWREGGTGAQWGIVRLSNLAPSTRQPVLIEIDDLVSASDSTGYATREFRASNSGSMKWSTSSIVGDPAAAGVTILADDQTAFTDPAIRLEQSGLWSFDWSWSLAVAGVWSGSPGSEPNNILDQTRTTTSAGPHTHDYKSWNYATPGITARATLYSRPDDLSSWTADDPAKIHTTVLRTYGTWLSASQYGGFGSTLLNVDAGTELRMLASVITWFGSGNGAKIAQEHFVLERVGEKV